MSLNFDEYVKHLTFLDNKINKLSTTVESNKNNNEHYSQQKKLVGGVMAIGNKDTNGIFTIKIIDNQYILRKVTKINSHIREEFYLGYPHNEYIIFVDGNKNKLYKMKFLNSLNYNKPIQTPEIQTNKLDVLGNIYSVGDAKVDGTFTVKKDITGESDLILTKNKDSNDGNMITLYDGKVNGSKIIFKDQTGKVKYFMNTPESLKFTHKLDVPNIDIGNYMDNKNGNVLSLYSGSKSNAKLRFLDNKGGINTYLQGDKYNLYTPTSFKTDADMIAKTVYTDNLYLRDVKNGSTKKYVNKNRDGECGENEFVCGVDPAYSGLHMAGLSVRCCRFGHKDIEHEEEKS